MIDHFALLGVPRRPWLDPETLKVRFIELSTKWHPDRAHGQETRKRDLHDAYTELNAAYGCLLNPKMRLSHLIELERGARASELQDVPSELMNIFMEVGGACKRVDRFLTEKAAAKSPLLQVQFFERGQQMSDDLLAVRKHLEASRAGLEDRLRKLDAEWMAADAAGRGELVAGLEELRRLFAFFDRWLSQVQERFVQVATC